MLHFDAHPDLACPSAPAVACFRPRDLYRGKDLYEHLDSTASGIAEWILPLVLAAKLKKVYWVPSITQPIEQIPVGKHSFLVGAYEKEQSRPIESFCDLSEDAEVKVDWRTGYYLDDASVVDAEDLCLSQRLELIVDRTTGQNWSDLYSLDVCLDYFHCRNPFLSGLDSINPQLTRALQNVVLSSPPYARISRDQSEVRRFHDEVMLFCKQSVVEGCGAEVLEFAKKYQGAHELRKSLLSLDSSEHDSVMSFIGSALPNILMPHHDQDESSRLLDQFASDLPREGPMFITIARSSQDGFTPSIQVDEFQEKLLALLHTHYCDCGRTKLDPSNHVSSCCFSVTFDYGD